MHHDSDPNTKSREEKAKARDERKANLLLKILLELVETKDFDEVEDAFDTLQKLGKDWAIDSLFAIYEAGKIAGIQEMKKFVSSYSIE